MKDERSNGFGSHKVFIVVRADTIELAEHFSTLIESEKVDSTDLKIMLHSTKRGDDEAIVWEITSILGADGWKILWGQSDY